MIEKSMRLAKTMAHRGFCSRREADQYILNGCVKVNGQVIKQKGFKVSDGDKITLNSAAEKNQSKKVTLLLNKPVGFVSAQPEKGYKAAVSLVTLKNQWHPDSKFNTKHLLGLAPAGRLDIDSKGLLVLTNDGRVARQLIGPNSDKEKEYLVRVKGHLQEEGLSLLQQGLILDGEQLKPAKVRWQNEQQLHFVLKQGKKRQIRRMCTAVGLEVIGLKRVRIGNVRIAGLPEGKWRYLKQNEHF